MQQAKHLVSNTGACFCLEVCAKRAILSGAMRSYLPGSFGVGLGVSPHIAAPVIRVDPVSPEGRALLTSWVSEPECTWVHIRCPRSIFPVLHSCHLLPQPECAANFVTMVDCLLSACKLRGVPWSLEAPARSSVWDHSFFASMKPSAVQINLCHFGHAFRAPLLLASLQPQVFACLGRRCEHAHKSTFQRVDATPAERKCAAALAECIAFHLGLSPAHKTITANQAAQVLEGQQPSKLPFRIMPEFKCVLRAGIMPLPVLDSKQCLKQDLTVQGMCIPTGSKLLLPSFFKTGDRMGKAAARVVDMKAQAKVEPPANAKPGSPSAAARVVDMKAQAKVEPPANAKPGSPSSPSPLTRAEVMSPTTSSDPPKCHSSCVIPIREAEVMSSKTSRIPPEPPKPKRIKVMSSTTDSNPDPMCPALLGFRSSEQCQGLPDCKPDPMFPALIGFSPSDPRSAEAVQHHVDSASSRGAPVSHTLPSGSVLLGFSPPDQRQRRRRAAQGEVHPAEAFAKGLDRPPSADDVCELLELLPGERPARFSECGLDARERAWTSGAYSHGGIAGLRHNAVAFPESTRLVLNHVVPRVRQVFGDISFTALGVFCNILTPVHSDLHNQKGAPNYVLPLCAFEQGGIWVEDDQGHVEVPHNGSVLKGRVLPVHDTVLAFDPTRKHCTQEWGGSRIICVCFTPSGVERLSVRDYAFLSSLGFPMPTSGSSLYASRVSQAALTPEGPTPHPVLDERLDLAFGVYYSEREFVREASCLGHPRSLCGSLPGHIAEAVDCLAKHSHHEVLTRRHRWLAKWTKRASEINAKPDPRWEIKDKAMAGILCKKRLQLLHEIIEAENYPDKDLAKDIWHGFDLVGRCPTSGVMPGKLVPATLLAEDLQACARKVQDALRTSLGSSGDHATDVELWDKTLAEASKGWLVGPFEWESLAPNEVPSHRFPLRQGGKLRPIDDYSLSGVNACVTTLEAPTVDTVDVAAAMAAKLCWSLKDRGRASRLVGRSYDLTSAYRQLCVSKESRPFAIVAVYDPHRKRTVWFRQVCLPFGSKASVNGFIRCGRCIQWLANRCLWIAASSYYDDYIVLSDDVLEVSTGNAMDLLFALLGWEFDKEGAKADVFSSSVSALGVVLRLERTNLGTVLVDNTDKRRSDLDAMLSGILSRGCLESGEGLSLRGKLSFADSHVMGRAGRYALKVLSDHLHAVPFRKSMSSEVLCALKFMRERLRSGVPRFVPKPIDRCFLVFTDACFHDDGSGGLGAVLISPRGSVVSWFGMPLQAEHTAAFLGSSGRTCIGELETIAVPIAYDVWSSRLEKTESVNYIDNVGAQFALVKGCSSSLQLTKLCHYGATLFEQGSMLVWHARVPSSSNIADSPSKPPGLKLLSAW